MASVSQVLGTTELLESILYELPPKDLLLARRICKEWKATIDDSIKLQQALFFTAVPYGPLKSISPGPRQQGLQIDDRTIHILKNPLLKPVLNGISVYRGERCYSVERAILDGYVHDDSTSHPSWRSAVASWRRMLPTQPPLTDHFTVQPQHRVNGMIKRSSRGNLLIGQILRELDLIIRREWCHQTWLEAGHLIAAGEYLSVGSEVASLMEHYNSGSGLGLLQERKVE